MGYDYTSFVTAWRLAAKLPASNAASTTFLESVIDFAEQSCYRDLDLINTVVSDASGTMTVDQRTFDLPTASGRFVVLHDVNLINGTIRTPLVKSSRPVIDMLHPDSASVANVNPDKWAPLTDQTIILGPSPSSTLALECIGTIRPTALSASNTNTFLSDNLPDLFFSAAMIFTSAYKQNFGAQADNPEEAASWQNTYDRQLKSAASEEMKRKYQGFYGAS